MCLDNFRHPPGRAASQPPTTMNVLPFIRRGLQRTVCQSRTRYVPRRPMATFEQRSRDRNQMGVRAFTINTHNVLTVDASRCCHLQALLFSA